MENSRNPILHPIVHEVFNEQLYYYFFNGFLQWQQFRDKVRAILKDDFDENYSLYPVYGWYDGILRLWGQPTKLQAFEEKFLGLVKETRGSCLRLRIHPNDMRYLWAEIKGEKKGKKFESDEIKKVALVYQDDLISMQEKTASIQVYQKLEDLGLVLGGFKKRPPELKQIRCFLLLQFLERLGSLNKIIMGDLARLLKGKEQIHERVICYGEGEFPTILIRVVADGFHVLTPIWQEIQHELSQFAVKAETYLTFTTIDYERDGLDSKVLKDKIEKTAFELPARVTLMHKGLYQICEQQLSNYTKDRYGGPFLRSVANGDMDGCKGVFNSLAADIQHESRELLLQRAEAKYGERGRARIQEIAENLGIRNRDGKPRTIDELGFEVIEFLNYWDKFEEEGFISSYYPSSYSILKEFQLLRNDLAHGTREITLTFTPKLAEILTKVLPVYYHIQVLQKK